MGKWVECAEAYDSEMLRKLQHVFEQTKAQLEREEPGEDVTINMFSQALEDTERFSRLFALIIRDRARRRRGDAATVGQRTAQPEGVARAQRDRPIIVPQHMHEAIERMPGFEGLTLPQSDTDVATMDFAEDAPHRQSVTLTQAAAGQPAGGRPVIFARERRRMAGQPEGVHSATQLLRTTAGPATGTVITIPVTAIDTTSSSSSFSSRDMPLWQAAVPLRDARFLITPVSGTSGRMAAAAVSLAPTQPEVYAPIQTATRASLPQPSTAVRVESEPPFMEVHMDHHEP